MAGRLPRIHFGRVGRRSNVSSAQRRLVALEVTFR